MTRQTQSRNEMGEEIVERPSWLLPAILGAITVVISLVFLYRYFGPTVDDLAGNTPTASIATRPIAISIGGHRMVIPENYTQFPRDRKAGESSGVSLYALLPRFTPFTLRTEDEFADNGPDSRVIHIKIEAFRSPLSEEERLERIYLGRVRDASGRLGPAQLMGYEFADQSGRFGTEDLFVGQLSNGTRAVFMCVKETAVIENPSCRRDFSLSDGLEVRYRFKRSRLEDWREINAGVVALIEDFLAAGETQALAGPGG